MLSLVALRGEPVGHILFTPVSIHSAHGQIQGMGLGPLSVLPDYQGQGIGSQLIVSGLERLKARGIPFVTVVGHPGYYTRFGFEPAAEFGIKHGFKGLPQSLLLSIRAIALSSVLSVQVLHCTDLSSGLKMTAYKGS